MYWNDKRYYSFDCYLKKRFNEKIYKVSLNANMTCPNRDGKIGKGGCIFCSAGGSGEFASSKSLSITEQIDEGKKLLSKKTDCNHFIAYFQAFTNTYASVEYLEQIFTEAIMHKDIVALSIGTRPDCLPLDVISLLKKLNTIKPVFIELGLQTINETTAKLIRRGYPLSCFDSAVNALTHEGIEVIVHLIANLPGEHCNNLIEDIKYINKFPISGIKISMLHILKNTDLAKYYEKKPFSLFTLDEYADTIIKCLEQLRPDIVVHRITGDPPKELLIEPKWTTNKRCVLNTINKKFKDMDTFQGRLYVP